MTKKVGLAEKVKSFEPSTREQNSSPVCYLMSGEVQEDYRIIKSEEPMSETGKDHNDPSIKTK